MYPQQQFEQPASGHSRLFVIVCFICFAVLALSVFWFVRTTNEKIQKNEQTILEKDQQVAKLQAEYQAMSTEKNDLTKKYDELGTKTCNGAWSVASGCVQKQALLSPTGNETFCLGTTTAITWDTNILTEGTVEILLGNDGTFLSLDTVEASQGVYSWRVKENYTMTNEAGASETVTIVPGNMYTVSLKPSVENVLGGESRTFSITDCSSAN
jgi:hypothetical protein